MVQRRLLMGAEARALGHGGIRVVAGAAGVREATVSLGAGELEAGAEPLGRARRPGGGRKRLADLDRGLRPALLALAEPDERDDPMSPLRWTAKSLRVLSGELTRQGRRAGPDTVAGLLREEGFSLQGNAETIEGNQVPDRDAQFRYLNEQVREHRDAGGPAVSVDAKKKELAGSYRSGGREWGPAGRPARVKDLSGVSTGTIATAESQVKPLLKRAGHAIEPAAIRLTTLAGLTAYASAHGITLTPKTKPAR